MPSLDWFKQEIISVTTTALAFLAVDGIAQLMALYNGDITRDTVTALVFAFGRSIVKAVIQQLLPETLKALPNTTPNEPA